VVLALATRLIEAGLDHDPLSFRQLARNTKNDARAGARMRSIRVTVTGALLGAPLSLGLTP
jgi:hypothetical protein